MRIIQLTHGYETKVSDVDYEMLAKHSWRAHLHNATGKPYAVASIKDETGKRRTVYMHRLITNCPRTFKADHKNRDTLDNQRGNLRIATFVQNNANREGYGMSGYKGVTMASRTGNKRWRARIAHGNGTNISLGYFPTQAEAAKAYDAAAHAAHGEFAYLNFPEDYPPPPFDFPTEQEIPF